MLLRFPSGIPENCIQCGNCSLVCPHGCIRPFLLTEEQAAAAPESFKTVAAKGKEFAGKLYRMQVSPLDCTGCGNCVQSLPRQDQGAGHEAAGQPVRRGEGNWEYAIVAA